MGRRVQRRGGGGGGGPPGGTDIRAPRFVVGNAPNGDVATDCDFLDTGNGAGIALALAAAAALPGGGDVWVRPGTYDLSLAGAPVVPFNLADNVVLRGAGPNTLISGRVAAGGDYRIFTLQNNTLLENLSVSVPAPVVAAPPPVAPGAVIDCLDLFHTLRNVWYDFAPMNLGEYSALFATVQALVQTSANNGSTIIDGLNALRFYASAAPSGLILGSANKFTMVGCAPALLVGSNVRIDNSFLMGGDDGVNSDIFTQVSRCAVIPAERGVRIGPTSGASVICNNEINVTAGNVALLGATCRGVQVDGTDRVRVTDNFINASTLLNPVVGSIGVWLTNSGGTSSHCMVNGNVMTDWDTGTLIDFASTTHVVTSNRLQNCTFPVVDNDGSSLLASNL